MLRLSQTVAETWVICTPCETDPDWHTQLADFNTYTTEGGRVKLALEEAAALTFAVLIRSHPDRGWKISSHSSDNQARMQGAVERALRLVGGSQAA